MEQIELVIRLQKKLYDEILSPRRMDEEDASACYDAIKNGTPLPNGHGDLKDVSRMVFEKYLATDVRAIRSGEWDAFKAGYNAGIDDARNVLIEAPTIIEADKEGAETEIKNYLETIVGSKGGITQ